MNDSPLQPAPKQTGQTIVAVTQGFARSQPDKPAFTFLEDGEGTESRLTYSELDRQARAIAAHLLTLADPGERALLFYPSGLEYVAAFMGCQYAGLIPVPLPAPDPTRPERSTARMLAIAKDAQARLALTTFELMKISAARLPENRGMQDLVWVATDGIQLDQADAWQALEIDSQSLAFIQYTSGSTGSPRGVMISHANLLANVQTVQTAFSSSAASRLVNWQPLFHDFGLVVNLLHTLYIGAHCTLMPPVAFLQRPARWLQAISRQRADISMGPNFAYELCIRKISEQEKRCLDLSCWRVAGISAEPVRLQTIQRFANVFGECGFRYEVIHPSYGLAESTAGVTCKNNHEAPPGIDQGRVSCGRYTWLDQKLVIVDPLTLQPCSEKVEGEIWLKSSSVAQGYWNRPEETRSTFEAYLATTGEGPFLRTGDLGYVYRQELYVTGRIKDLIIIRGANHYPQDIELTVEQSHPALRPGCGAAFSIDIHDREQLMVAQEVRPAFIPGLKTDEILHAIRTAIVEEHQLQAHTILLLQPGSIPKTSSGKIQRHACREQFLRGELKIIARDSLSTKLPADPHSVGQPGDFLQRLWATPAGQQHALITEHVRAQLAGVLGLAGPQAISLRQRLSDLGMDLPRAIALTSRLQSSLGNGLRPRGLRPTLAFDYPTLESLVNYLMDELRNGDLKHE